MMKHSRPFLLVLVFLICFASLGLFAGAEDAGEAMPVSVNAKAAILVDVSTGRVLCAQNEHERYSPASMTKIMPLLLITEAIDEGKIHLDDKVTASATAAAQQTGRDLMSAPPCPCEPSSGLNLPLWPRRASPTTSGGGGRTRRSAGESCRSLP